MADLPPELRAAIEAALDYRASRGMGPGRLLVEIHDNGEGIARRWVITHEEVGPARGRGRKVEARRENQAPQGVVIPLTGRSG